jgi:hypothetical protein
MATSHVVDGATEHRLLRPAAPMEVSAELLGQSDDDALRATQESSCRLLRASSGGFDGREREEGDDRPAVAEFGAGAAGGRRCGWSSGVD